MSNDPSAMFSVDGFNSLQNAQAEEEANMDNLLTENKRREKQKDREEAANAKKRAKAIEQESKNMEIMKLAYLKRKINQRFEKFADVLASVPRPSKNAIMAELEQISADQVILLNGRGGPDRLRGMIKGGTEFFENFFGDGTKLPAFVPEPFRLDLTGLSVIMESKDAKNELEPLIEETVIEYPEFFQMGLIKRWIQSIGMILMSVNALNKNPQLKALRKKQQELAERAAIYKAEQFSSNATTTANPDSDTSAATATTSTYEL